MTPLPAGTVWLASYPKSGNTWMRLLLANALSESDAPQDINAIGLPGGGNAARRALLEWHALVDSTLLTAAEIERLRPRVLEAEAADHPGFALVKAHDAYTRLPCGTPVLGRAGRAALYLVRDPRDVAVSLAFHLDRPLEAAVRMLNNPAGTGHADHVQFRQRLLDWSGHVDSWLGQTDLPVRLIRYEDLLADTRGVLAGALDFLGIRIGGAAIERAVRHADFRELRRQEDERDFRERAGPTPFFRNGRAGDWRHRLPPEQVRLIESRHGAMMRRLGYLPPAAD